MPALWNAHQCPYFTAPPHPNSPKLVKTWETPETPTKTVRIEFKSCPPPHRSAKKQLCDSISISLLYPTWSQSKVSRLQQLTTLYSIRFLTCWNCCPHLFTTLVFFRRSFSSFFQNLPFESHTFEDCGALWSSDCWSSMIDFIRFVHFNAAMLRQDLVNFVKILSMLCVSHPGMGPDRLATVGAELPWRPSWSNLRRIVLSQVSQVSGLSRCAVTCPGT